MTTKNCSLSTHSVAQCKAVTTKQTVISYLHDCKLFQKKGQSVKWTGHSLTMDCRFTKNKSLTAGNQINQYMISRFRNRSQENIRQVSPPAILLSVCMQFGSRVNIDILNQ